MALVPPPGPATFSGNLCPLGAAARFGVTRFGTSLLQITSSGSSNAAVDVNIKIDANTRNELTLYGPVSHVSVPAGASIPIGVRFARMNSDTSAATSTIRLSWRDAGGAPGAAPHSAAVSVVCNMTNSIMEFVPSDLELVASAKVAKSAAKSLVCQTQVAAFAIGALPAGSPFSASVMPTGSFLPTGTATLTLAFSPAPGASLAPQVVNVTAGGQVTPFICWVADTLQPGDLTITGFNADPPNADLGSESVTVRNNSGRTLDLTGCVLRDEAGTGRFFHFPDGFTLAANASVTIMSGTGTNTAATLFWKQRTPVWNNDFDTAVLFNFAGDEIARRSYILALQGVRPQNQTKIFDAVVPVFKALASTPVMPLEDGDFVVLDPDPTALIWTGNVLRGSTGPAGVGIADDTFPQPGVPAYSLLAEAGGPIVPVGGAQVTQLLNRTSAFKSGQMLYLMINDDAPGAFGTSGNFLCRVRIFRK
jgi:hypothetical protein